MPDLEDGVDGEMLIMPVFFSGVFDLLFRPLIVIDGVLQRFIQKITRGVFASIFPI